MRKSSRYIILGSFGTSRSALVISPAFSPSLFVVVSKLSLRIGTSSHEAIKPGTYGINFPSIFRDLGGKGRHHLVEVIKLKQMANHLPVAGGSMIMHDPGPFPTSLTLIRRRGNYWNSIQGTWPAEKWNQRCVGQMISTWPGSSGKLIYHQVSCVT